MALARVQPGQINYASSGIGSVGHMAAELFAMTAGIKLHHIPYKGNGQAISEVLAGQVPLMTFADHQLVTKEPRAYVIHIDTDLLGEIFGRFCIGK